MIVGVCASCQSLMAQAEHLAKQLALPWQPDQADALLRLTPERLELVQTAKNAPGAVFVDFVGGKASHRRKFGGGRSTHLAHAAGLKPGFDPEILDATAGLGRDAFVLASLGCQMTLVERSPIIGALLQDGLARASLDEDTADIVARMKLVIGDARSHLANLPEAKWPDVVYLDPMYPHKDKSALAKKEMRLFQQLLGKDDSGAELLHLAMQRAKKRITVKRPIKAEALGDVKPNAQIQSQHTRYDLYLPLIKSFFET